MQSVFLAPPVWFEQTTLRLTAECSTAELRRNIVATLIARLFYNTKPDLSTIFAVYFEKNSVISFSASGFFLQRRNLDLIG